MTGVIHVPGDKSISHRSIMFGSIAKGTTRITNFLDGEDCLQTIRAFQALGVPIEKKDQSVTIEGSGINGLKESTTPLYFGNSGTTARLMVGLLAGLPFLSIVHGDPFLTNRPMDRVINPLREMGAQIDGRDHGHLLPLAIRGTQLSGIRYELPVKSAQVKSAVLLAGLRAEGTTTVIEKTQTRNHTENMLQAFGADITVDGDTITVTNQNTLQGTNIHVPGDISSAAFWLVAAAIVPNSNITLKHVGLNQTRTGIIDVLDKMDANITITNEQVSSGESAADMTVKQTALTGITIDGDIIPRLIDEIPIIALLATQADGKTIIKDAAELRVKETDRIEAVVDVLSTLGADITPTEDGMIVEGPTPLTGGRISAYNDHRIAMMGVVASLIATEPVYLDDDSSIAISYPDFFIDLKSLTN